MAEKPASERTEQPTGKVLAKAKGKGQTVKSQELMSFMSILVLVTMVAFMASPLCRWCIVQIE